MAYSRGTVRSSSLAKGVYNPRAFFPHAALLRQACAHCGKFLAAASRRSLGRISVPVWLTVLSDQLRIVALVGRYPTNKLIRRRPLQKRPKALVRGPYAVLAPVSRGCPPLLGRFLRVTHPSAAFHRPKPASTRDLHALGTPPAFILSQDQTLQQRTASQRRSCIADYRRSTHALALRPRPEHSRHTQTPSGSTETLLQILFAIQL